jgi:hypothetical protein
MKKSNRSRKTTSTRITPEVRARLDEAAISSGRSLAQEIEIRLEQSLQKAKLTVTGSRLDEAYFDLMLPIIVAGSASELRNIQKKLIASLARADLPLTRRLLLAVTAFGMANVITEGQDDGRIPPFSD